MLLPLDVSAVGGGGVSGGLFWSDDGGGVVGGVAVSLGGAVAAAAPPDLEKRAVAFSPPSTVTLCVSVAPSGPLKFTVCAPASTAIASVSGAVPTFSPSTVTSVPAAALISIRPSFDRDWVSPSLASARCLSVMSLPSVRNCLKYLSASSACPLLRQLQARLRSTAGCFLSAYA